MSSATGGRRSFMSISEEFLLRGCWYAVEQAGRLLHDGLFLHSIGRFPSAAALAVLGIEELGRGRILRDMWRAARAGKLPSLKELQDAFDDHVDKLRAGQTLFPLTLPPGSGVANLARLAHAGTPESQAILTELKNLTLKRGKRTPQERHEMRLRALHVDPDEAGTRWNRPADMTDAETRDILNWGMADYRNQLVEMYGAGDLGEAFKAWPDRPALPDPVFPRPG